LSFEFAINAVCFSLSYPVKLHSWRDTVHKSITALLTTLLLTVTYLITAGRRCSSGGLQSYRTICWFSRCTQRWHGFIQGFGVNVHWYLL